MANRPRLPAFVHSIQSQVALTYLVVIAAVLILLNTYPLLVTQDLIFQSKRDALKNQATVMASALAVSETLSAEGVEQAIALLDDRNLTRIIVTDQAGFVLCDTQAEEDTPTRYALLGEIVAALEGKDVFRAHYRDGVFESWAAAPIVARNVSIGAVYLYERDGEQGALLQSFQKNIRTISVLICAVVLALSLMVSRLLTRRIAALLTAIRIVRAGEYSHRVDLSGRDELAQLADEFNQLTGRLQTTEEMRRRFASDASHELKTPLASIRLLTDSILQSESMDTLTTREFVSDIGMEADRLTRISEKLLNLTRLDAAQGPPPAPVAVGPVVRRVCHMVRPLAQAVDVTLIDRLAEDCVVMATEDELYQVAFNLVENAVKYNLPGGMVEVTLTGAGDTVTLTVEDSGVGIPEEDLPRVFDRFYRVDKARSRAAGGTGLGLSIVQATVLHHGGTVTVHRCAPSGVCFTVRFPRYPSAEEGRP